MTNQDTTPVPVVAPRTVGSAVPATPLRRTRLDSLTGLRFVAAFTVFGRHVFQGFHGQPFESLEHVFVQGGAGVSFFFVLSGFVLCWSRPTADRPRLFYRRRFARIVPNHVVTWMLAVVLGVVTGAIVRRNLLTTLLLVQAWVPNHGVYFALNGVAWSLSCEMFFYLMFPFVLPRVLRLDLRSRRWLMFGLVAAVFVIALLSRSAQDDSFAYWFAYIFPPIRLMEFVIGILIALEVLDGTWPRIPLSMASALAVVAYGSAGFVAPSWRWVAITLIPFMVLVGAAAHHDIDGRPSIFRTRALVRLGIWSYAFYLCHWMVIKYVTWATGTRDTVYTLTSGTALAFGLLALSILAGALLYRVVERPFERRLRPRQQPAALAP